LFSTDSKESRLSKSGGKANFLLDLGSASNMEKEIQTCVSANRDSACAQGSCCRTEIEGTVAKMQHPGMAEVC